MSDFRPIWLLTVVLAAFLFFSGCSSTKTIQSQKTDSEIEIDGSISDWPSGSLTSGVSEDFDIAVVNDDQYVYIAVNFRNNRTYQMARDFGFRIYLDSDRSFRRSFGIVYPIGIATALADIPGARKSYLENPGWRNIPENARMIESVESELPRRVMVVSRSSSDDRVRPARVPIEQVEASDIRLGLEQSSRAMSIELKVPIRSGSGRDFGIDPDGNNRFLLGFEIEPPSYTEVTGERVEYETVDASQQQRDSYGRRSQSRQQLNVSNPQLYYMLRYNYQSWVKVRLDK